MRKKRILLVDDDVEHTFGIEQRLKMDGFNVERATNAKQAWEMLQSRRKKYYGVIIDIMMPADGLFAYDKTDQDLKTGILLCEKIKKELGNDLKIIGLTNHHDEKIKKQFIQAGGNMCCEKVQGVAGIFSQHLSK
jgi:CheY-like chemotaxis protein